MVAIRYAVLPLFLIGLIGLIGCGSLLYEGTLSSSMAVDARRLRAEGGPHAVLVPLLVEEGYEIELSDRDAGIITTRFRGLPSPRDLWPFKYSLRIAVRIRRDQSGADVTVIPTVRGVHRVIRTGHTDYAVLRLAETTGHVASSRRDEARHFEVAAQEYTHLLSIMAETLGVAASDVEHEKVHFKRQNFAIPFARR